MILKNVVTVNQAYEPEVITR